MHGDFPFNENLPAAQSAAKLNFSNAPTSRTAACSDKDRMAASTAEGEATAALS